MRVGYLVEWDISRDSGVLTKIRGQVKFWQDLGVDVKLFFVTPNEPPSDFTFPVPYECYFEKSLSLFSGFIRTYLNKIFTSSGLIRALDDYAPDIIYFRQSIWHPGLEKVLTKYPSVVELNTIDDREIVLFGSIKQILYRNSINRIYRKVKGAVSVSYEIDEHYEKYSLKTTVIANGYDFDIGYKRKHINKNSPNVIFVASPNQPWQGEEKLLILADHMRDMNFHVVGPELKTDLPNVRCHGYLSSSQLHDLYPSMDFGIGSLSLYKKGMGEASTLKTREYAAYCLPMVLGYKDTDLHGSEYLCDIGNHEGNVKNNLNVISDFIRNWKGREVDFSNIQEKLSSERKEASRVRFFRSLLNCNV